MKRFFLRHLLFAAVMLCFVAAGVAAPAPAPPSVSFGEWHVSGSDFVMNWTTGDFSSPSRITLTRPGNSISADRISGNEKRRTALLTGNVVVHDDRGSLTSFTSGGSGGPATLTCDRLNVDGMLKMYVADGSVHFVQGGREGFADEAIMNGVTHMLELKGNVRLNS